MDKKALPEGYWASISVRTKLKLNQGKKIFSRSILDRSEPAYF
jgi:hypothetical protein